MANIGLYTVYKIRYSQWDITPSVYNYETIHGTFASLNQSSIVFTVA